MNSPIPVLCHQLPSSSEGPHSLKTEDYMAPYPYDQSYNHHFCFDPASQHQEGLNVTGLMRIMPFPRPYQGPSYKTGPYYPHIASSLPIPYDPTTLPAMLPSLPIALGQPHSLQSEPLLVHHQYPSPAGITSESHPENLSPIHAGTQATLGGGDCCVGVSHTVGSGGDQLYRGDQCEGVVNAVGPSPPLSSVEEECNGGISKRRKTGSLSSDQEDQDIQSYPGNCCQEGLFPGGTMGGAFACSIASSLKWQAHVADSWVTLCDEALQEMAQVDFQVEANKGFVFSVRDNSYVCQKKNHFQISVHLVFHKVPKYVKLKSGVLQPIEKFLLLLNGIKFESSDSTVQLEQSLPDRSKVKFEPIQINVPNDPEKPVTATVCRLHFSETTANNMRKRGRPNPDQKHFCVVVCLSAQTAQGNHTVVAHISERIIVRASNPGHFENDYDYMWLKSSLSSDAICHHGKVGINTEKPEEALTVNGHIQLTGQLLQLSDMRLKRNITRANPAQMLDNISKLQLYEYQLMSDDPNKSSNFDCSLEMRKDIGLLAQELNNVIPDAVQQTNSSMTLRDGTVVPDVLVISKERVFMETVGAVQELVKSISVLERRVTELAASQQKNACPCCLVNKPKVSQMQSPVTTTKSTSNYQTFPSRTILLLTLSFVLFVICF